MHESPMTKKNAKIAQGIFDYLSDVDTLVDDLEPNNKSTVWTLYRQMTEEDIVKEITRALDYITLIEIEREVERGDRDV